MENADKRNIIDPKESRNLIAHDAPAGTTCKAVKFSAASVAGYEA